MAAPRHVRRRMVCEEVVAKPVARVSAAKSVLPVSQMRLGPRVSAMAPKMGRRQPAERE